MEGLPLQRRLVHIALTSALGLIVELLLIRWLDSQLRHLALVKNLPLIASFLGLGIGYALANTRRSWAPLAVPLFALALGIGVWGGMSNELVAAPWTPQTNTGTRLTSDVGAVLGFYAVIAGTFALTVLATLPFGQLAGMSMHGVPTLKAYTANIVGALAGVLAVFACSGLGIPPWAVALVSGLAVIPYLRGGVPSRALCAVAAIAASGGMLWVDSVPPGGTVWSPYNRIAVSPIPPIETADGKTIQPGYRLAVQNLYYQRLLDLRPETVAAVGSNALVDTARFAYDYPYRWRETPGRVLVVGAGTGNDVASALRHGATHVTAVEIDPEIVEFGRRFHPEKPYADPRVTVVVEDARKFFRSSTEHYDMVVFGLLDSHYSHFSGFSNSIRLDNYVYTVEGLGEALKRLSPDGVLTLSLYVERPFLITRVQSMLGQVAGRAPMVVRTYYDEGTMFVAGPGVPEHPGPNRPEAMVGLPQDFVAKHPAGPMATDAWPFLYMSDRVIPEALAWSSVGILIVAALIVGVTFRGRVAFDRQLFFLGAGFLLLETRTIAQLGLFVGTTWQVSGLTIAVILGLILIANAIVIKRGALPTTPLYGLLLLALLGNYMIPVSVDASPAVALLICAFQFAPLFLAGLLFASVVSKHEALAPALASNLLGAVLGGLLENACLLVGIPGLSLVALVVYGLSMRRS